MGFFLRAKKRWEDIDMGEMIAAVVFIVLAVAAGIWVWWLEK